MAKKSKPSQPSRERPAERPDSRPRELEANPAVRLYFFIGAALSVLISLATYVRTMAPSAPFWDAGEFIATAYTLGVPHSPGTPLYVLVGRVFTLLPLPFSIAGKINLISVLSGSLGVLMVYILSVRFLDGMLGRSRTKAEALVKVAGGLVGALFITFSYTYWTNATEAEVYSMSVFFMGLMTWLGLKWADNPGGARSVSYVYLLFYLLALSVGFHLGTILAFSGVFFLVLMTREKTFTNAEFLLACFGMAIFVADATLYRQGQLTVALLAIFIIVLAVLYRSTRSVFAMVCSGLFLLGISVHLYLLIRSGHNPSIDEADPETWRNLYAVLRREQYPPTNVFIRKASFFGFQIHHFNDYFQDQFKMMSAYVGKLNVGSVIPLALGLWGMVDHYTKHRKGFILLFSTWVVTSLGMIVYLNFSDAEVRERDYFYLPAFYYFAVFISIGAGSLISEFRRLAARWRLTGWAPIAVPAAILLALPLFTARLHFFAHDRSRDFVCREYAKNMLVGLDPNGILFTNGDNDTFPLWYIQEVEKYRADVRVVNLSLLNTPWYIKQLRDNEPRIDIRWSDAEIQQLQPIRTTEGWVLVRDIGVQHIIRYNGAKRPVYFAVTIPPEYFAPYREFMEMEGLVYRVVPRKGDNMINREKMEENVWHNYSYAGLLDADWKYDDTTYQPPFVRRLIQNYAAAFTQLGYLASQEQDYAAAIKNLEPAEQIAPDLPPVVMWLGWYYLEIGDTARGVSYYKEKIESDPDNCDIRYRLAGMQERIDDVMGTLETLEGLMERCPEHRDAVLSAAAISARNGLVEQSLNYMDRWVARHPTDEAMRQTRQQLLDRVEGTDSVPVVP
jgi:tetratricopeptide (TPR) repeat protein